MYKDITNFQAKVNEDSISSFFESIEIKIKAFGSWKEKEVSELESFISTNFRITYITSGEAKILHNNETYQLKKGDYFLFYPFEVYSTFSNASEILSYTYITFDISPYSLRNQFEEIVCSGFKYKISDKEEEINSILISKLLENINNKIEGYMYKVKILLLNLLINMAFENNRYSKTNVSQQKIYKNTDFNIVQNTIDYIEKNISMPLKVSKIAKDIGVSESTLHKSFKAVFNMAPSKFISQYKVKKADEYLKSRHYTVEQIAFNLGFSSSAHLRKAFKQYLGKGIKDI